MKTRSLHVTAMMVIGALGLPSAGAEDSPKDILIVANQSVPVSNISEEDVRSFFLKKAQYWRGGTKVLPINARAGTELRAEFRDRILNMSADEEVRYWQDRKIKSGLMPPPEFSNVLKAVFKLKGAISYVYRHEYKERVSQILLVLPAE